MTPEVSVIIPTYNRRAMVREAIESVLAQSVREFELIVIDDGSTDGTAEELARLGDAIRVERIEHRGPAAARNRGVEMARAPLIAFLDSDDLWAPNKLERQLAFMRANPGCAISQTNEIWIRNGRRVNPGLRHRKRAGDIFIDSLRTCLISMSATMMRTDLFRSLGGFDEIMDAAEDYDLWLRILIDHEVGLLDEPLVTRRGGHPDQTLGDDSRDRSLPHSRAYEIARRRSALGRAASRGRRSARREMPHLRGRPRASRQNRSRLVSTNVSRTQAQTWRRCRDRIALSNRSRSRARETST